MATRCTVPIALALLAGSCGTTPGGGNTPCLARLGPGDLVITEVLANPVGTDDGKEWIEIYNPGAGELDLTQVRLVASKADGSSEKTHVIAGARIGPGKYLVLGGMVEAARLPYVNYTYGSDLGGLGNSGGALALRCGDMLVDKMLYAEAGDGRSKSLDGKSAPDAIANDDLARWCDSQTQFEPGSYGTPGAPNDSCGGAVAGTCKDANGMVRPVNGPQPGQLVFNELMPNPAVGTDETKAEWIELAVTAPVDLNGLALGASADPMALKAVGDLSKLDCIPVAAGSFVLLVRSRDPMLNGGLPPGKPSFLFDFSLVNGGAPLSVASRGVIIDTINYGAASDGASIALDPGRLDATKNDDAKNWCKGATPYGAGGKGTPGAANESCGIIDPGMCLEAGKQRAKVVPKAGDILVNEVMPNPGKVADTAGEWFELKVTRDVDLNGLQLGVEAMKLVAIPEGDCRRARADSTLLFVRAGVADNGGLPMVPAWQSFTFSLSNTDGALIVAAGGPPLDQYLWKTSFEFSSWSRDPVDGSKWCRIVDDARFYNGVDRGTPGAKNPPCP